MGAPKGNKYALGNKGTKPIKYTKEVVKKELEEMLARVIKDKTIIYKKELTIDKAYCYDFINEKIKELDDKEIKSIYKKIDDIISNRVLKGATNNKYNANMSKLHLSANYGFTEKKAIEHSGNIQVESIFNNIDNED